MPPTHRVKTAVIFDLDSTLCLTEHRHHLAPTHDPSKTWVDFAMACSDDVPNWGVIVALNLHRNAGCEIHIVSGREPDAYELTETWLARHGVKYDNLVLLGSIEGVGRGEEQARNTSHKVEYVRRLRAIGITPVLMYEDWPAIARAVEAEGVPVCVINPCYQVEVDVTRDAPDPAKNARALLGLPALDRDRVG